MTNNFRQARKNRLLTMLGTGNRNSFTLIELLVVLALVAILSVVVVMTLNPAELIKQARDSNRLSDLATINTALNLFSADVTSGFMGTSTVVYVSLPDNASSTCGSWGLPTLPSGYTYNCVTTANLRNTNGTGWIPVNFQRISSNSPISQLPIDPQNTTSTKYYTYVTGGSWQLATKLESAKYQTTAYSSGGADPSTYTIGNNLSLAPFVGGMVGWWKFDGDVADYSGFVNNGTWNGTSTSRYVLGKVGQAGYFNGSSDYVAAATGTPILSDNTISTWWYAPTASYGNTLLNWYPGGYLRTGGAQDLVFNEPPAGSFALGASFGAQAYLPVGTWVHYVFVTHTDGRFEFYKNGTYVNQYNLSVYATTSFGYPIYIGKQSTNYCNGYLDDLRIYNRALSAAEVSALYNATK